MGEIVTLLFYKDGFDIALHFHALSTIKFPPIKNAFKIKFLSNYFLAAFLR